MTDNRSSKVILRLLTGILFVTIITVAPSPIHSEVSRYLSGNPEDVNPTLAGVAYNLGGGGADVDPAIQWMINTVRGCTDCQTTVDVVVIREQGDNGYNQPILQMDGVDSVETLVIQRRQDADNPEIIATIAAAEVIFFAGGDQCHYVRNYRNTGVETAVKSVIARGGAVGGTSAGAMIQGQFIFDACGNWVTSKTALFNPYEDIYLTSNLFNWKLLDNTIIDTHFYQRDRMGRLMTFVARLVRDGEAETALGIGIDEATSLLINAEGIAQVMGEGSVYFVLADHLPKQCEPQTPLTFRQYKIWKKTAGEVFQLNDYPSEFQFTNVRRGRLHSNPY